MKFLRSVFASIVSLFVCPSGNTSTRPKPWEPLLALSVIPQAPLSRELTLPFATWRPMSCALQSPTMTGSTMFLRSTLAYTRSGRVETPGFKSMSRSNIEYRFGRLPALTSIWTSAKSARPWKWPHPRNC